MKPLNILGKRVVVASGLALVKRTLNHVRPCHCYRKDGPDSIHIPVVKWALCEVSPRCLVNEVACRGCLWDTTAFLKLQRSLRDSPYPRDRD